MSVIRHVTNEVARATQEPSVGRLRSLESRFLGGVQGRDLPPAPEDPEDKALDPVRAWACRMFHEEFMRTMIAGDEDKLGMQPEPWD